MQEQERSAGPRAAVRYWWVNHNHRFRQEIDGNYLWSPKKDRSGDRNASYDNMARAVPRPHRGLHVPMKMNPTEPTDATVEQSLRVPPNQR
jgi:hypothetical protein